MFFNSTEVTNHCKFFCGSYKFFQGLSISWVEVRVTNTSYNKKKICIYKYIYTPVFKKVDVLKIYIKYTYLLYSCQNCQNKQKRAIDICLLIYILRTSTFLKTAVYIYISCFMRNTPMAPLHNMCFLSVMVQKIVLCDCLKMLFTLVLQQSIENCSNNSFICSCAFYLCCQGEKLAWMYMYLSWVTNHS